MRLQSLGVRTEVMFAEELVDRSDYLVARTPSNPTLRQFVHLELEAGRLRQGWGWKPEHDLRILSLRVRAGAKLSEEEAAVWRNRRLLDTESDGLKPGDIVIVPNIPDQGRWALARVTGPYRYEPPATDAGVGTDYAHVVPVEAIRGPDARLAIVEADNEHVDARLRASLRNMSRMWSADALGAKVDDLIAAIEGGKDTGTAQPEATKAKSFLDGMRTAAWVIMQEQYKGAEFEHLVHRLFKRIYKDERNEDGRVEHWGGAGEKGADLIVFTRDALGLQYKIAVQVKMYDGVHDDTHALDQIKQAHECHQIHAGVIVTTAEETSAAFTQRKDDLEDDLAIDIRVITRDEFVELVMTHLGSRVGVP